MYCFIFFSMDSLDIFLVLKSTQVVRWSWPSGCGVRDIRHEGTLANAEL